MVDIQSPTAEIRRGKKEDRQKSQGKNTMVCPIKQGDHKEEEEKEEEEEEEEEETTG